MGNLSDKALISGIVFFNNHFNMPLLFFTDPLNIFRGNLGHVARQHENNVQQERLQILSF